MSTTNPLNDRKQFDLYKGLLLQRNFRMDMDIKPDKVYLKIKDNIVGTSGNFITITGLPKHGKSTFLSPIISSFDLQKPVLDFAAISYKDKSRIGFFDTEQSPYDFKQKWERIEKMAGRSINCVDRFLTRQDDAETNKMLIDVYLRIEKKCGIIIIDGLLDLIQNMNDEKEAKDLVNLFKKWSLMHDCLIAGILHLGKKDKTTIGHIGSAFDRASQSVFKVEKMKDGSFLFMPEMLRSCAGFDGINIMYNHNLHTYTKNNSL
jgi:hypothetical protein